MTSHRNTVIFWGAGATAALCMPSTQDQADFLCKLAPSSSASKARDRDLCSRVRKALQVRPDDSTSEHWIRALQDLLTILGDELPAVCEDAKPAPSVGHVTPNAIKAMRDNSRPGASDDEIRERIIDLRTLYDWLALKDVIIIFMGYSLPPDDVAYHAFFAARSSRKSRNPPKCSVVLGRDQPPCWLRGLELDGQLKTMDKSCPPGRTLEAARGLFGKENVRFYGGGIPQVFLGNGNTVTESAMAQLLDWDGSK